MVGLLKMGFREVMRQDQLEEKTFWLANMGTLAVAVGGVVRVMKFERWMKP